MSYREGPRISIVASCGGCVHERTKKYRVQGDSGTDVTCAHPDHPGRIVGDTTWTTPAWCPYLAGAIAAIKAAP